MIPSISKVLGLWTGPGWQGRERKARLCRSRAWCRWEEATAGALPWMWNLTATEGRAHGKASDRAEQKPAPKRPGSPVSADSFGAVWSSVRGRQGSSFSPVSCQAERSFVQPGERGGKGS